MIITARRVAASHKNVLALIHIHFDYHVVTVVLEIYIFRKVFEQTHWRCLGTTLKKKKEEFSQMGPIFTFWFNYYLMLLSFNEGCF